MASNDSSTPFLHRLADSIKEQEGPHLIVLPNRRSLFVLKDLLADQAEVETTTIDDLMQRISGLQLIDPEELQVSFYGAYCKQERQPQSFDVFSSWAVTFLGDVNDVDLHLGDIDSLYQHIHEFHQTGAHFTAENAGPIEHGFLSFWERLPKYYHTLREELDRLKLGYRGLIYRKVAEMTGDNEGALLGPFTGKHVHWVGIVPGNPSERTLLEHLEKANIKLDIYADIDKYYSRSPHHEAGRLFREYPLTTDVSWEIDVLCHAAKDITIHPLPGTIVQVSRAKALLEQIGRDQWFKTVVVVPDSTFVTPFIKLFEDDKDRINITSGFPMRNTMIHRFIMSWMNLHANANTKGQERFFYHKYLEEFLGYGVVKTWLSGSIDWEGMRHELIQDNARFVPASKLKAQMQGDIFGQQAFDLFFQWDNDAGQIFQKISTVLTEWSSNAGKLAIAKVEQRAIKTYVDKLKLLLSQFNELLPDKDVRSLKRFVHRQVGYARLYIEEPNNDALQVMGMLETRMIDFEHVIVLGASEDSLPGPSRETTHIPFIHRLHFDLPSRRETEALVAYHFYRLITRAKSVDLIYDSVGDEMSSGEPSRYILQLHEELLSANAKATWKEVGLDFKVDAADLKSTRVEKTPEVIEDILGALKRGLSPSAINTFVNSPLEFYFSYVLGIKEQQEVEEDIEHSTFGTRVHNVLEQAYQPFVGKQVDVSSLKEFLQQSDEAVEAEFLTTFQEEDIRTGRNLLKLEMAKEYVRSFILYDIADIQTNGPVKLLHLEEHLGTELEVDGQSIKLKGFADRIDERSGEIRIIDYKTGRTESKDLRYDPLQLPNDRKMSKAMQLAIYKFIYCTNHRLEDAHVGSYVFSMRNFTDGYMPLFVPAKSEDVVMDTMATVIRTVVRDMLDPTQAFQHKADSEYTAF